MTVSEFLERCRELAAAYDEACAAALAEAGHGPDDYDNYRITDPIRSAFETDAFDLVWNHTPEG